MASHRASTSKKNAAESTEYEELNKEQRLKAALYHGIKQISREVEDEMDIKINSQVLATLCESLSRQTEIYAMDLELFAKHARRTNISLEDVKLLARRNDELLEHLNGIAAEHTSEKDSTKRQRKGVKDKTGSKKGSKGGVSENRLMDVDD